MDLTPNQPEEKLAENGMSETPRKMKLVLQDASAEELSFYTKLLIDQNRIGLPFYLALLASVALTVAGLIFNSPTIVLAAVLLAPYLLNFVGVPVYLAKPSLLGTLGMLLQIAVASALFYFGGQFGAIFVRASAHSLPLPFLLENNLFYWFAAILAALLTGIFHIRQSEIRRLSSAFLSALIFPTFALLGWKHQSAGMNLSDLLIPGTRIFLALYTLCMAFWFSGLPPKRVKGWLGFALITLALIGLFLLGMQNPVEVPPAAPTDAAPTSTAIIARPTERVFTIVPSNTPTLQPTITPTPEPTLTPTPAPLRARVTAINGLNCREEASLNSAFVAFLRYNTEVTMLPETASADGYDWVKIELEDGRIAWTLSEFIQAVGN